MPKDIDYLISESAYYWAPAPGIAPAVMHVNEAHRRALDPEVCVRNSWWCLDYVFEPWQHERIGSLSSRWFRRDAFTGFLFAPGTAYWEKLEQPTHAAWIGIRGGDTAGLDRLVARRGWAQFRDPDHLLGDHMVQMARSAQSAREEGFHAAQAGLWRLIELLSNATTGSRPGDFTIRKPGGGSGISKFSTEVRTYLASHIADRIALEDIARHMGVSVSGLCHRYKLEMRESPMRSHLRFRMDRVRQLLLKGYKLQAIADETGFSSTFHLSAMFKRLEGVPPSVYVRMLEKA